MAVLQIAVHTRSLNLEAAVVTKEFVACGYQDFVTTECHAAQAPVAAAALEVYLARIPVDVLKDILFLKINRIYAAVTLAVPAAAYD